MAREIKAGVQLNLKDKFSERMKRAGVGVQGFAGKAVGAANKVNKAFSGLAGKLGAIAGGVGVAGAIKSVIDLEERMVRIGINANASAAEVNKLKRQIFETAMMPDIKLNADELTNAVKVITDGSGDLQFVKDNMRNIALAMQATGASGEVMGGVFNEFSKFEYTAEEISSLMDKLTAQGKEGRFNLGDFATHAPTILSAYSAIGSGPEHMLKANAAMQILREGTRSAAKATSVFSSTMSDLTDPSKQQRLRQMGISVRDRVTGEFRDFDDIMFDIVAKAEKMGGESYFSSIFSESGLTALRAYRDHGEKMYDTLTNLGDTTGVMQSDSARMAGTMKANLQNLQTAFKSFADSSLSGPLEKLTNRLNKFAENPEKITRAIRLIKFSLIGLASIKVGAGLISMLANIKSVFGGKGKGKGQGKGKLGKPGSGGGSPLGKAAGAAIPVYVTNWGAAGSQMMHGGKKTKGKRPGISIKGKAPRGKIPAIPQKQAASLMSKVPLKFLRAAGGFGVLNAAIAIPGMIRGLKEINQDKSLTGKEKGAAKGGVIGDAGGSILGGAGGALAGAKAGAILGSIVPGIGNIVGGVLGAGIGLLGGIFGGKAGRKVGTAIGGATARDDKSAALPYHEVPALARLDYLPKEISAELRNIQILPPPPPEAVVSGEISLNSILTIDDKGYRLQQKVANNSTPYKFALGNARSTGAF
jgi:hypothetical protein